MDYVDYLPEGQFSLLCMDYMHYTDWTFNTNGEIDYRFRVLDSFVDTSKDYIVEMAIVRVSDRDSLRTLIRILSKHKNIKDIVTVKSLNEGYPKNLLITLRGDSSDSTRYIAHTLGGIEAKALYEGNIEHWCFIFPTRGNAEAFMRIANKHGSIARYEIRELNVEDVLSAKLNAVLYTLSDVEYRLLKRAYEMGYFKIPKAAKLDDIAKEFNLSKPTIDEYLRRGIGKIVRLMLSEI